MRYLEAPAPAPRRRQASPASPATRENPTAVAWRFSPVSNNKRDRVTPDDELRVLVATDVLSEGQNLQDCSIVVNFDLPWAIIRLIQRAGRVDRIGQKAEHDPLLLVPARRRRRADHPPARPRPPAPAGERRGRRHRRSLLRGRPQRPGRPRSVHREGRHPRRRRRHGSGPGLLRLSDLEERHRPRPGLEKIIPELAATWSTPPSRTRPPTDQPEGVLVYLRTAEGNDALAWVDKDGNSVTESQFAILKAAECQPDTPALPRHAQPPRLVAQGRRADRRGREVRRRPARPAIGRPLPHLRAAQSLCRGDQGHAVRALRPATLHKAIEDIYRYPLRQSATDTLNRQLRSGIADEDLAGWSSPCATKTGSASSRRSKRRRSRGSSARWACRLARTKRAGSARSPLPSHDCRSPPRARRTRRRNAKP